MIKAPACLIIGFLGCVAVLYGQEANGVAVGAGGLTTGYGSMPVSKLHVFVPDVPAFKNDFMMIGGTGHVIINRLLVGVSGSGIRGQRSKTDSVKTRLGGGSGTIDFGYRVLERDKIKIYPALGIGIAGFGLRVSGIGDKAAASGLENGYYEIRQNHFVMDLSVQIHLLSARGCGEKNGSCGWMTGLKIGYLCSRPTSHWFFSGAEVTSGPTFGFSMFYVNLIVGGFAKEEKQKQNFN